MRKEATSEKTVSGQNKHYPGPWIVGSLLLTEPITGYQLAVLPPEAQTQSSGRAICLLTPIGKISREDEANARLIAAAPELLETLKALVEVGHHAGLNIAGMVGFRQMKNARAAISKAEGK